MLCHVRVFETPWTVTRQPSVSMEFSRQQYWSGLPFPPPGDLLYLSKDQTQDSCLSCIGRQVLYLGNPVILYKQLIGLYVLWHYKLKM